MNKLDYDIKEKYSHELEEIGNKLKQLEDRRIYEISNAQMDGYLANNIEKLRQMICKLLSKIQNGDEGFDAEIAQFFK